MGFYFVRISAEGHYALAAMVSMFKSYTDGEYITVISISEKLGISKIYLEQVFFLLKGGGLVNSIKGTQGGYQLSRIPRQITMYQVLSAVELSLFESAEGAVVEKAPDIEKAMRLSTFEKLDKAVVNILSIVVLAGLATEAGRHRKGNTFMFYI